MAGETVLKKSLHVILNFMNLNLSCYDCKNEPKNEQRYLLYLSPSLAFDVIREQTTKFRL